jgi:lysozyme
VGRNLTGKPLSDKAIAFLLTEDYEEALDGLFIHLPWFAGLDEARQMVLIDMTFNLGIAGLLKFTNTLRSIEEGRWHDASIQMLASRWAKQVGARAVDLAKVMATGVLPERWRE